MDAISPVSDLTTYNRVAQAAAVSGLRSRAGEEFLTIFYKEMLKDAIKPPSLTYDPDGKDDNAFFSAFNTDIMVEQFAKQLAKTQMARPGWMPAEGDR